MVVYFIISDITIIVLSRRGYKTSLVNGNTILAQFKTTSGIIDKITASELRLNESLPK